MNRKTFLVKIVVLFVLSFSQLSFANNLEEQLLSELKLSLKPIPETVILYHYFFVDDTEILLQSPLGRKTLVDQHMQTHASYFWNMQAYNNGSMMAGAGLYTAVDPLASRNYGNTAIEIKINKPAYYLNLVGKGSDGTFISLSLAQQLGIPSHTFSIEKNGTVRLNSDLLSMLLSPEFNQLKHVLLRVFKKLNAVGFEYSFATSASALCSTSSRHSALVIIGTTVEDSPHNSAVDNSLFTLTMLRPDLMMMTDEEKSARKRVDQFENILQLAKKAEESGKKMQGVSEQEVNEVRSRILNCK